MLLFVVEDEELKKSKKSLFIRACAKLFGLSITSLISEECKRLAFFIYGRVTLEIMLYLDEV